jgi:hypothetical protein
MQWLLPLNPLPAAVSALLAAVVLCRLVVLPWCRQVLPVQELAEQSRLRAVLRAAEHLAA